MITKWYLWCAYNITLNQVKRGKAIQKNIDDNSQNNEIMVINLYGDINDNNDNNSNINNINDNNNNNNIPLPSTSFCLFCWLWTYFTYFFIVSATEFEHAFSY